MAIKKALKEFDMDDEIEKVLDLVKNQNEY
jgi:hypothetical protein